MLWITGGEVKKALIFVMAFIMLSSNYAFAAEAQGEILRGQYIKM